MLEIMNLIQILFKSSTKPFCSSTTFGMGEDFCGIQKTFLLFFFWWNCGFFFYFTVSCSKKLKIHIPRTLKKNVPQKTPRCPFHKTLPRSSVLVSVNWLSESFYEMDCSSRLIGPQKLRFILSFLALRWLKPFCVFLFRT